MGKYSMTTRGRRMYDFDISKPLYHMSHISSMDQPAKMLEKVWDKAVPYFPWDWDDYESVLEWSTYPIIGRPFEARAKQLEYAENQRWLQDYAKNTGISLDDIKYPIRAGLYRGYASPYATTISATQSVLSLYGNSSNLLRWL